ncbi:MAG: RNA methyltransferase [Bacteroidales bacterium]|jgi:tRNA (guanosine-2'-O-)-methyltransferase|nr:RNA methyltransferase [Bacteroidales bacterium]
MENNKSVVEILSAFVTGERTVRIEKTLSHRTRYITVVLEDIYQSQNVSAVLRTCECLGVQDVHIIETFNPYRINPMVLKGSDKWLNIFRYDGTDAVVRLKKEGYRIVATALGGHSTSLYEFDLSAGKCAIVFGNEKQGVSNDILNVADELLEIPMWGFTQSLNISVSAGVILSHLLHGLKQGNAEWRLNASEQEDLRALWLKNSIKNPELILGRYTK